MWNTNNTLQKKNIYSSKITITSSSSGSSESGDAGGVPTITWSTGSRDAGGASYCVGSSDSHESGDAGGEGGGVPAIAS